MSCIKKITKTQCRLKEVSTKISIHLSMLLRKWATHSWKKKKNLVQISSKVVLSEETSKNVYTAAALREDKFNRFFKKRLCSEDESLYDVLKKNKLQLFKQSNLSVGHKSKEKMKNLTADRKLFSRLFIACQTRKGVILKISSRTKITAILFQYLSLEN